jgi:metal-sulfur cluster biosynthetic enzyme
MKRAILFLLTGSAGLAFGWVEPVITSQVRGQALLGSDAIKEQLHADVSNTPIRTDSIGEKIRLLEKAYQSGRRDLAMSLAESLKDTLDYEEQEKRIVGPLHAESEDIGTVEDLPPAWAGWAEGWSHYLVVSLVEGVGIERVDEPVHIRIAIPTLHLRDPWREIRVAYIHPKKKVLQEVPSQVLQHVKSKDEHRCEVVFQATVAQHDLSNYMVFFGNPNAELPDYITDLQSRGEGYGLEVQNHHYVARLSRQMGQLERLTSKRDHGLELFAGGKGHGEPPTIDWANDYVDKGHFQKLRIRNWANCPNYEVVRGPVCIRVRRWGFPHGPIHPVFAPSRVHVDQTYTFYPRLPYFFKEGTMEVIKDVEIAAMRDDEWVFSGYSFDATLWIDRQGNVREGNVPTDHANDLWGVGFFHRTSRDALVALWLKHESDGFTEIQHSGSPTLHYNGHGQLWSRYPVNEAALKSGTTFLQRNAYLITAYPEEKGRIQLAQLRKQLVNPLQILGGELPAVPNAKASGRLARRGETNKAGQMKQAIWKSLLQVKDEQLYSIDANIVDLGYVYDIKVEDSVANILVTMPHRGRPIYEFLVTRGGGRVHDGIQETVRRIDGIRDVVVDFTWESAWNIHRATKKGRMALGLIP